MVTLSVMDTQRSNNKFEYRRPDKCIFNSTEYVFETNDCTSKVNVGLLSKRGSNELVFSVQQRRLIKD